MNMSIFDPESFLDATLDAPLEKRPPLPVGDYTAIITKVSSRTWQGKADPTKSGVALDVVLTVDVPYEVQTAYGLMPTLSLRDSIMLDLTPQNTVDLSPGKNTRLRIYREALDMNKKGDVFSPRKMEGRPVRIAISHEIYNDAPVEKVGQVVRV